MDKHRLELFSDGVFVIILTLLVLDLKSPAHPDNLAGLYEVLPGLLVHAVTFFVIGMAWFNHHNMLARVHHVSHLTLLMNLLALFWVSLMPFGARIAAEHPTAALGIGLFTACRGFYSFSLLAMRRSAHSHVDDYPELKPLLQRRTRLLVGLAIVYLVAAPLCWVSPWFGYAALLTTLAAPFIKPVAEAEQTLLARRLNVEIAEAP